MLASRIRKRDRLTKTPIVLQFSCVLNGGEKAIPKIISFLAISEVINRSVNDIFDLIGDNILNDRPD